MNLWEVGLYGIGPKSFSSSAPQVQHNIVSRAGGRANCRVKGTLGCSIWQSSAHGSVLDAAQPRAADLLCGLTRLLSRSKAMCGSAYEDTKVGGGHAVCRLPFSAVPPGGMRGMVSPIPLPLGPWPMHYAYGAVRSKVCVLRLLPSLTTRHILCGSQTV